MRKGPQITTTVDECDPNCIIQSFAVSISVHQGDYLAWTSTSSSFLKWGGDGDQLSVYSPSLGVGGSFLIANATDGCYPLLQAVY